MPLPSILLLPRTCVQLLQGKLERTADVKAQQKTAAMLVLSHFHLARALHRIERPGGSLWRLPLPSCKDQAPVFIDGMHWGPNALGHFEGLLVGRLPRPQGSGSGGRQTGSPMRCGAAHFEFHAALRLAATWLGAAHPTTLKVQKHLKAYERKQVCCLHDVG